MSDPAPNMRDEETPPLAVPDDPAQALSRFERILITTFRRRTFFKGFLLGPAAYVVLRLLPGPWVPKVLANHCYWVNTGTYCNSYCATGCCPPPFADSSKYYWCTWYEEECYEQEEDIYWRTGNKFCGCSNQGCNCANC